MGYPFSFPNINLHNIKKMVKSNLKAIMAMKLKYLLLHVLLTEFSGDLVSS